MVGTKQDNSQVEIRDHVPDGSSSVLKTKVYVEGGRVKKLYFEEKRAMWEKEGEFNQVVEASGFPHKPKLFTSDVQLQTEIEYIPGRNGEIALAENPSGFDYGRLIDVMINESRHLGKIDPRILVKNIDPYSGVRRLLSEQNQFINENDRSELEKILSGAENAAVLARLDPELSNFIIGDGGEIHSIDYSLPLVVHPIHNPAYMIFHFDLPRKNSFFGVRDRVASEFYEALSNRLGDFVSDSSNYGSTFKAAMINFYALDWLGGRDWDSGDDKPFSTKDNLNAAGNPDYQTRVSTLRNMINYDAQDMLKGAIRFRKKQ